MAPTVARYGRRRARNRESDTAGVLLMSWIVMYIAMNVSHWPICMWGGGGCDLREEVCEACRLQVVARVHRS